MRLPPTIDPVQSGPERSRPRPNGHLTSGAALYWPRTVILSGAGMDQSSRRMPMIEDESGWLQYHSVGRFPGQREAVGAAMNEFADMWLSLDDRRWTLAGEKRRRAIELWA